MKYISIPISIIFLHFTVVTVYEFDVTLIYLLIWYWVYANFRPDYRLLKIYIPLYLAVLLLPLINFDFESPEDFFRTYLLYAFFFGFLLYLIPAKPRFEVNPLRTYKYIRATHIFVCSFAAAQLLLLELFDVPLLYNIWGERQFFAEYDYALYLQYGILRAAGFYLEPSVLGMVISMLFWARMTLEGRVSRENTVFTVLGLFFAGSLGGWATMLLISLYKIYRESGEFRFRLFVFFVLGICMLLLIPYIPRLDEFGREGTSLYWRFIAPTIVLLDVIPNNITGLSFGSMYETVYGFSLIHGQSIGGSIDNGHLLLIYYFGIFCIPLYLCLSLLFVRTTNFDLNSYLVFLLSSYFFSGAIFNLEYTFIMFFFPIYILKLSAIMAHRVVSREGYMRNPVP